MFAKEVQFDIVRRVKSGMDYALRININNDDSWQELKIYQCVPTRDLVIEDIETAIRAMRIYHNCIYQIPAFELKLNTVVKLKI